MTSQPARPPAPPPPFTCLLHLGAGVTVVTDPAAYPPAGPPNSWAELGRALERGERAASRRAATRFRFRHHGGMR